MSSERMNISAVIVLSIALILYANAPWSPMKVLLFALSAAMIMMNWKRDDAKSWISK